LTPNQLGSIYHRESSIAKVRIVSKGTPFRRRSLELMNEALDASCVSSHNVNGARGIVVRRRDFALINRIRSLIRMHMAMENEGDSILVEEVFESFDLIRRDRIKEEVVSGDPILREPSNRAVHRTMAACDDPWPNVFVCISFLKVSL